MVGRLTLLLFIAPRFLSEPDGAYLRLVERSIGSGWKLICGDPANCVDRFALAEGFFVG